MRDLYMQMTWKWDEAQVIYCLLQKRCPIVMSIFLMVWDTGAQKRYVPFTENARPGATVEKTPT